eukprot:261815-Alexandrium_andersonii.AAC.1
MGTLGCANRDCSIRHRRGASSVRWAARRELAATRAAHFSARPSGRGAVTVTVAWGHQDAGR